MACFVFLATGGNHSYHEVMVVAKRLNLPYEINNYSLSISTAIKESSIYKNLAKEFPEFLSFESTPKKASNF